MLPTFAFLSVLIIVCTRARNILRYFICKHLPSQILDAFVYRLHLFVYKFYSIMKMMKVHIRCGNNGIHLFFFKEE